jgi:hypothetical protein
MLPDERWIHLHLTVVFIACTVRSNPSRCIFQNDRNKTYLQFVENTNSENYQASETKQQHNPQCETERKRSLRWLIKANRISSYIITQLLCSLGFCWRGISSYIRVAIWFPIAVKFGSRRAVACAIRAAMIGRIVSSVFSSTTVVSAALETVCMRRWRLAVADWWRVVCKRLDTVWIKSEVVEVTDL